MKKTPPVRRFSFLEHLFTRQERMALVFLVVVSFLGLGILALEKVAVTRGDSHFPSASAWEPVDINRAGLAELVALPGIGPKTAQRILTERRQGRYLVLEDLKRVKGISQSTLMKLKGMVRFH